MDPLRILPPDAFQSKVDPLNKILIVDDDSISRSICSELLLAEGFRVEEADSGEAAVKQASCAPPDLILMDVMMPGGMDGFETAQHIHKSTALGDVPIIFMTSLEDRESRVKGFAYGAVDYLTKPAYREELLARIRVHLRLRQSYQALARQQLQQLESLREAQTSLLPQPEELPQARFAAAYLPLGHAGGDFFDVFQSGENTYDYLVADVSGHDLGASLPTSAIKALIRQNATMAYTPVESLRLLNTHLATVFAEGQYATLGYLRLNHSSGQACWTNAGHLPALQLGTDERLIDVPGSPVGCFEFFEPGHAEFTLSPGDRLLLLSDGVVEQVRGALVSRAVGFENLREACRRHRDAPLEHFPDLLLRDLHPDPAAAGDDLLLLGIERRQ
ncbi:MAG: PP2C family protein-serine/threonine phosphatase [Opitutales bacterium]